MLPPALPPQRHAHVIRHHLSRSTVVHGHHAEMTKIFTNAGSVVSFQVQRSIRQRGLKCGGGVGGGGGDMAMEAGDVHNRHAM